MVETKAPNKDGGPFACPFCKEDQAGHEEVDGPCTRSSGFPYFFLLVQHITAYHYSWCSKCKRNFKKYRNVEKFDEFMKEHTCDERYWQPGEEDRSHKCMTEQQAADWKKNSWKGGRTYEGVSNAVRNWRNIYRMLFPEGEKIPSHSPTIRHKHKPETTQTEGVLDDSQVERRNGSTAAIYESPYDLPSAEERQQREEGLRLAPPTEGATGPRTEGTPSLTTATTLVEAEEDAPSRRSSADSYEKDPEYIAVLGMFMAAEEGDLPSSPSSGKSLSSRNSYPEDPGHRALYNAAKDGNFAGLGVHGPMY